MCPDNTQFLSYLAARTSTIKLQTTAVILPWNDPLRVIEKIALLDNLADGRVIFGMGRGLARREFEAFRLDMGESRGGRFDEAAEMILRGLEEGYAENDGTFYKQPRVPIHPPTTRIVQGSNQLRGNEPRLCSRRRSPRCADDGLHPGADGDASHAHDRRLPEEFLRHPRGCRRRPPR